MKDFENFFKSNSAIMLLIDAENGNIADANKAALKFYGYRYNKMLSLNIGDLNILPKTEIKKQISGIIKGKIVNAFYKHRTAYNAVKDIQVFISLVIMNSRKYIFGIIQDVTQLKIKQEESSRFKKISDSAIPFIGIANMRREVYYFNDAMRKAFAVPKNADLSKYKVFDFYTPKGKRIIKSIFTEIAEKGFWKGENEMRSLNGQIYQVHQTIVLIKDENGIPLYTSSTAIDITQQKKVEQKITDTAFRYKTLLKNSGEGIHVIDSKLKLVEANKAFCKMLGYTSSEVKQLSLPDLDMQWTRKELKKRMDDLMNQSAIFETKHRRKDGTIIDVEINATGILIEGRGYLYASARDITERKFSEKKLRLSESKFRALLVNSFDAIGVHTNGIWELCNPAALKLFGYSSTVELIGKSILNVIAPQEHERIKAFVRKRTEGKEAPNTYITRGIKKHGEIFDLEVSLSNFIQNDQLLVIVTLRDISARLKQEMAVKESFDQLKKIASLVPGVVFQYQLRPDGTSCFPYASAAMKNIYGINPEEIKDSPAKLFERIYQEDFGPMLASIQKSAHDMSVWRHEYRVIFEDRSIHWLLGTAVPQKEEDGSVLWYGFITDFTESKKLEDELIQLNEKLEMAMDQSHLAYWEMNASNSEFTFNDQFYRLYETTAEKEGGYQMKADVYAKEFLFAEDVHIVPEDIALLFSGQIHHLQHEHRIKTRNGNTRYINVWVKTLVNNKGDVTGTYGCNQDITEKKKKEEEILQLNNELKELAKHLQKLRADERNKLALEVHDKLGQKLVGMKFEVDYLKEHIKKDNPEFAKKIIPISEEFSEILKDFNAIYTDVNPTFIDDLDLFDAIDSLIMESRNKNNFKIKFSSNLENVKYSHDIKWVMYKTLEECLNNVIIHSKAKKVIVKINIIEAAIQLEVEDDGSGFDISKLNMSKQIGIIEMRERINAAGGNLVFDSVPGMGTYIKVTLKI